MLRRNIRVAGFFSMIICAWFSLNAGSDENTYTGYLDSTTTSKTHSFTLQNDGEIRLTITYDSTLDLSSYFSNGLEIFCTNGTRIFSVNSPSSGINYGPFGIKSGTYYWKINRISGTGNYTLKTIFNAQIIANDKEPNDTYSNAVIIKASDTAVGHLGYKGGNDGSVDEVDIYKTTIEGDGAFKINITYDSTLDLSSYYYNGIEIYDTDGTRLFSVNSPESGINYGPYGLKAGTYYIKIIRSDGYGGYSLSSVFTLQQIPNDIEPNNSFSEAKIFNSDNNTTGHLGYLGGGDGSTDIVDIYKLSLINTAKIGFNIVYDSTLDMSSYYSNGIEIYDSAGKRLFAKNSPESGIDYGPYELIAGTYYIKLNRSAGYGGYTYYDPYSVAPAISVLTPNSGSVGTPVTICGSYFGSTMGAVKFNGVATSVVSWANTEIKTSVPSGATTGSVIVYSSAGRNSNAVLFTVTDAESSIAISSPNGGESWEIGSTHDITWTTTGTVGDVKIEYSINGGTSWTIIATTTENDGIYSWTIPNTLSTNCLIKISEIDGNPSDESNSAFSIIPAGANAQNIVLIDLYHGRDGSGIAKAYGCNIKTNNTSLSTTSLAGVKTYFLFLPNNAAQSYASDELTALNNFVASGGNILVMGGEDNSTPTKANPLLNLFGMSFGSDTGQNENMNSFVSHALTEGLTLVTYIGADPISVVPPAKALGYFRNNALIGLAINESQASSQVMTGSIGKVVALADYPAGGDSDRLWWNIWGYLKGKSNWVQKTPLTSPPGLSEPNIVFDAAGQKILLFGGRKADGSLSSETWIWDGTDWTKMNPATSPSARVYHAMAFDSARNEVLLFGGYNGTIGLGDTWTWDGSNWVQKTPTSNPSAREYATVAFDEARNEIVLFGGGIPNSGTSYDETWRWNGTTWTKASPAQSPVARTGHSLVFDKSRNVILLFGGRNNSGNLNDTWAWDGTIWTQQMPTSVPEKRYKSSLAYDANINSAILFGGVGNGVLSDTWIWNGGNWFKQYPSLSPNARYSHKMTYDATRNEVILIGGYDGSTFFNDTWSWKGATQLTDNPPSVTITSPFADAKVSGQVIIQAKASDDKGIAKVEFYDDADKLGEETTTPFSLNWDTNALANGSSHNLKAKAYDTVGQTAEAQVTVTINKIRDAVPTVSITAPQNGTSVSGAVTIKATAYDDRGITKVEFYAKDALLETDSSYPYSCEWNTVGITGSATIKAKAYDTAGQNAIAQMTVNITGDQTPPKITMHPKGQTISSGSKAILSVAAEGAGSLSYQWYSGTTGKTANPIGNATSDSYTTPSLTTEASYWVRVSNAYGRADSNTAVIKVSSSAKLEGAVYSKSTNATISGASITVGTYPAVTTDNNGSYAISNISGGTYKATVSKTGFTTFSDNITIPASGTSRRDFYLSLPVGEIKVTAIKSKYNGILHYLVGTDFLVTYTAHVDWANHPPGKVRFITTKNTYDVATTGDTASKQLNLGLEFSACKTLKAIATSTDNTQSKEFSADFVMMSPIVALALAWQGIDLGDGFRYHTKTGFDFKFIDELIDENIIPENIPLFGKKGFNLRFVPTLDATVESSGEVDIELNWENKSIFEKKWAKGSMAGFEFSLTPTVSLNGQYLHPGCKYKWTGSFVTLSPFFGQFRGILKVD